MNIKLIGIGIILILAATAIMSKPENKEPRTFPDYVYTDALTLNTYTFAKADPTNLSEITCYCGCAQHSSHKNLKECFDSDHASYCDVCKGENLKVQTYLKQNKSIENIRQLIDKEYNRG